MTRILRPMAREATIEPILPQPMTPSVLPVNSTPMKRFFSHLPAWVDSVGGRDFSRQREHQRDRMLGRRDRIAEGRVHHDHAARRGGRDVDIVDADAGAAHDLQFRRALDELGGDFGRRTDRQAVVVADDPGELVLVEPGFDVDLDAALLEDGDGGRRELVGNENTRSHAESLGEGQRWSGRRSCKGL